MEIKRETKKILRKEILKKRDTMSEAERKSNSRVILKKIQQFPLYRSCENFLAFVSFGSEVDTKTLILQALQDGKKVYCPKVCGEDMIFYRIHSMDDLLPGYRGILEPKECEEYFSVEAQKKRSLLLVPGSVFDKNGNRIGYGKGYYDRFLEACVRDKLPITTLAIAFSLQLTEQVPAEKHDRKIEYLFTEKEDICVPKDI